MEYKIRALRKTDQRRVSRMFLSLIDKIDDKSICDIISPSYGGSSGVEITEEQRRAGIIRAFMGVFTKCIRNLGEDTNAFFADLLGVTVDEYEQMPFDIDIQVLEQLKAAPEVENFFTGASRLFNGTDWFGSLFARLKGRFDSVIKSLSEN